jgi:hypothetical protein
MSSRKYASGREKRRKRKLENEFIQSQKGTMDKYVRSNTTTSRNPYELALAIITQDQASEDNVDINGDNGNVSDNGTLLIHPVQNLLVLMSKIFLHRIYLIQKIGILLMTKLETC